MIKKKLRFYLKMKGKGRSRNKKIKVEIEDDSVNTEFIVSNLSFEELPSISDFQRRSVDDIKLKDLKGAQFQLEGILISATKRKKQIQENIWNLESITAQKNKRSRSTDSLEKKSFEEKPPKKLKDSNSKSQASSVTPQPKSKLIQTHYVDSHIEIPKAQRNDGPSRFWTFLEPYCADITQDTIRAIEDWTNLQDNNEKYKKIPELGQHFSVKWPLEDMKEEAKEGSKSAENNKGLFTDSAAENAEIEKIVNLGHGESAADVEDEYDSLTNRIIYSLIGENLMTFLDDTMTDDDDASGNPRACLPQSSSHSEMDSLQKRLSKDLHGIGLLEFNEEEPNGINDEVLQELKILQSALIPVNEYNTLQKKKVLALAKAEMAKQELKKKLQELDARVMEIYRIVSSARKNNTMSKKLEEQVKRTLREKKKLVEKLKILK